MAGPVEHRGIEPPHGWSTPREATNATRKKAAADRMIALSGKSVSLFEVGTVKRGTSLGSKSQ
jgi:hypothetical protein